MRHINNRPRRWQLRLFLRLQNCYPYYTAQQAWRVRIFKQLCFRFEYLCAYNFEPPVPHQWSKSQGDIFFFERERDWVILIIACFVAFWHPRADDWLDQNKQQVSRRLFVLKLWSVFGLKVCPYLVPSPSKKTKQSQSPIACTLRKTDYWSPSLIDLSRLSRLELSPIVSQWRHENTYGQTVTGYLQPKLFIYNSLLRVKE